MFRVQKVLLFEFEEIYEPVLIENPFSLVDEKGRGLRQYQVALTCSKLLFGCDNFYKHSENCDEPCWLGRNLDPEIECFELVSMLPLQILRFHFARKCGRYLMVINLLKGDNHEKPMIFEFGGHLFKQHFWYTWRDRISAIRRMHPGAYNQITYASPFSSTDVQFEEQEERAVVHSAPKYGSQFKLCSRGW